MKIGFIGAGNMGGSMIKALSAADLVHPADIFVYEKDFEKLERLAKETGTTACSDASECALKSDIIFIVVKPVDVPDLIYKIRDELTGKIIVSIAAGVKISVYSEILGSISIVRAMPNLPALVGEGMSVLYYYNIEGKEARTFIENIFKTFGKAETVGAENLIDEVIALTSSSPAYICMMIEAMADGAVRAGLPRQQAYIMAEQTLLGTAKYLLETGLHPAILKDQVCSPAGTTIEAVTALEKAGFRSAIMEAMESCARKVRK